MRHIPFTPLLLAAALGALPLAALAESRTIGVGSGWLLLPPERQPGEEAASEQEAVEAGEAAVAVIEEPDTKTYFCNRQLQEAERAVARMLADMSYTLTITAKGAAPGFPGDVTCVLTSTRTVAIDTSPLEPKN
ncbi:hypothetical protein [Seohaeicola zhoushanensis]|uniref:DUF4377 domain-containing protein n=1 Tax=Seohaeicola zhoushanensis TaxID=1569283 RepID=A0A8J3M6H0_9RHOB|nr:hypothetical protein [Seohaeicola zhoushanensis]GHF47384.1 hypothetical protein GCM10017056_18950 [Seohaeicola zhoushanensis]